MTKTELIKEIKMYGPLIISQSYLDSLDIDKLKKLHEKYVPKIKTDLKSFLRKEVSKWNPKRKK